MAALGQWNLNKISHYGFLVLLLASISGASSSSASSKSNHNVASSGFTETQRPPPPPPPPSKRSSSRTPFTMLKDGASRDIDVQIPKRQPNSQIHRPPPPPPRRQAVAGTSVEKQSQPEISTSPKVPPPPPRARISSQDDKKCNNNEGEGSRVPPPSPQASFTRQDDEKHSNEKDVRPKVPPPPPPASHSMQAGVKHNYKGEGMKLPPPPPPVSFSRHEGGKLNNYKNEGQKLQEGNNITPPPPPPPKLNQFSTKDLSRRNETHQPSLSAELKADDDATLVKQSDGVQGNGLSTEELPEKPSVFKKPPPPPPPRNVAGSDQRLPQNQSHIRSWEDIRRRRQSETEDSSTEATSSPSTESSVNQKEEALATGKSDLSSGPRDGIEGATLGVPKSQPIVDGNVSSSLMQESERKVADTTASNTHISQQDEEPSSSKASSQSAGIESVVQRVSNEKEQVEYGTESVKSSPTSSLLVEPKSLNAEKATKETNGSVERMKSQPPPPPRQKAPASLTYSDDEKMLEQEALNSPLQEKYGKDKSQYFPVQRYTAMDQETGTASSQLHQQFSNQHIRSQPSPNSHPPKRQSVPPPPNKSLQAQTGQAMPAGLPPPRKNTKRLPPRSSSPPVFKTLWSRVEKGLDDLASLDDRVAYQAQRFVSTAVNAPRRRQTNKPQERPKPSQASSRISTGRPMGTPQARWQAQNASQKKANQRDGRPSSFDGPKNKNESPQPSVSVHPYAASSYSFLEKAKAKHTPSGEKDPVRNVDWGGLSGKTRRLMPANGGASAPNDSQKWNQPGPQEASPLELPNGPGGDVFSQEASNAAPLAREDSRGAPTRQTGESGATPPQPNTHKQYPGTLLPGGSPPFRSPTRDASVQPDLLDESSQKLPNSFSEKFRSSMAAPAKSSVSAPTRDSQHSLYIDDDDEKASLASRIVGAIPVPRFSFVRRLLKLGKGSDDNMYASLDAWNAEDANAEKSKGIFSIFRRRNKAGVVPLVSGKKGPSSDGVLPKQVKSLLDRSDKGKSMSLLSTADERRVRKVGKARAIFDVITLGFFLMALRQVQGLENVPFPNTLSDFASLTLPGLLTSLVSSFDTWAPLAVASAMLTMWTNSLLFDGRVNSIASNVAASTEAEASYARLFLRLVSSISTDREVPAKLSQTASSQVVALGELSRLRSFVTYILATILFMTVTFIQPFIWTLLGTLLDIGSLEEWRKWPIPVYEILSKSQAVFANGARALTSLLERELKDAGHHPMKVAFKASILAALVAVAYLPGLERRRKVIPKEESDEEDTDEVSRRLAEQITNLGASSAGRLGVLSKSGWVEGSIERWRIVREESSKMAREISVRLLVRRLGYYATSWIALAMPLLLFGFIFRVPIVGWSSPSLPQWEALLEMAVLLLFTNGLAWKTISKVVEANDLRPDIMGFLESLSRIGEEIVQNESNQRPLSTSMNPTAGLLVKDLWAAHTVKRAWAVRGANLLCRNGEVLVLLGDDGAGKSRILTALAEAMILPPKRALTATKVRGSVAFGGIDVTQWDQAELKKRVGILLNDIRTMADRADMWSGMSLEEILEPGDVLKAIDPTHTSGATERACMVLGLKITGLYWSLLPRLPSKLSSVLTANEEDLRPSPLRPRYNVLSPTEWSKLMMAKLIAQQIYDNENSTGSSDKVDNSLIGSLFLLDDATVLLSETEETKLLRELRRTGAATVLTSNKWATGRLADQVAVVKDGKIAECGTHNELLSRGPQQSLYAAKWHAMTAS